MNDELYHYGVLGMKWGKRKSSYSSTGLRSAMARRSNEKVDAGFKKWKENSIKRADAIERGKKPMYQEGLMKVTKAIKVLKSNTKAILSHIRKL